MEEAARFSNVFQNFLKISSSEDSKTDPLEKLGQEVRRLRHRRWLECFLAELFQTASTKDICEAWSQTADEILTTVCDFLSPQYSGKWALFAYGKLGSSELNLSSDIDLVFVSEDNFENSTPFIRRFQSLIQEATPEGFCFRTDFDLRPGGRMGPLVPTKNQFEDYYGNYGEAWERLAFVRLRPIWGDKNIQQSVMAFVQKFTFRKHLDYSLFSDLKTLRQKIHSQYSHRTTDNQIDLKLGLGGIRDLELFVHALQVVHGGKDINLRQKQTSEAFHCLEKAQVIPTLDIEFLRRHYWHLRHLENLVQAEMDQQTHLLQRTFPLIHTPELEGLQKDMKNCDHIVSSLLGKVDLAAKTLPGTYQEQVEWLQALGYSLAVINETWNPLITQTALSRQKERDESFRQRFLYLFVQELSHFPESQNRSLHLLLDFVRATRAKATFYSLFLNHESLITQIARIFATSPYLAGLLISRPELIDSFVYRTHSLASAEDPSLFLNSLGEKKLLSELVNGSDFLSHLDLPTLTERISEVADTITSDLLQSMDPQQQLMILPLGKWGGRELGLRSDLDFIFLTQEEVQENHLRSARRFFSRLTETHQKGGSLYSIDLRLKPSGKGGLVVTSIHQLLDYLRNSADAWERQAYLRARPVNTHLRDQIVEACLCRKLHKQELAELRRIRQELLKNSQTTAQKYDLKYGPGGLVDIEFAAQICFLANQQKPESTATLSQLKQLGWQDLYRGYVFMRLVEQLQQAVSITSTSTLELGSEGFKFISSLLKMTEEDLAQRLNNTFASQQEILKRLDPRQAPEY